MVRDVIFHKAPPLYREPAALSRVQIGTPGPSDHADRQRRAGRALLQLARRASSPDRRGGVGRAARARCGPAIEPRPCRCAPVTPEFFGVLGIRPGHRRLARRRPRRRRRPARARCSVYRAWERLFDARADALGQAIWIDNQPYTIAGVLPRAFWFSDMNSPIWTRAESPAVPPDEGLEMIVRRPAGVSAGAARGAAADRARRLRAAPAGGEARAAAAECRASRARRSASRWRSSCPTSSARRSLLTLLIACANVAILMIAQWTAREHEIAIRASIGASRAPDRPRAADRVDPGRRAAAARSASARRSRCVQWARCGGGDATLLRFLDRSV